MSLITKIINLLKLILLGGLIGLLTLFFMPKSPVSFNWQEVNKAWQFYQQSTQNSSIDEQSQESEKPNQVISFSKAVDKAGPSVVSVKAFFQGRPRSARDGKEGDVLVDISVNVGSGVIFDKDGYIVTNFHVINGSFRVAVHFSDGRHKYAEVVGVDQRNDIAVLKVNIQTPLVAELGRSADVKTGDIIMAIGTPFGLFENSVTSGIVSSINHGPLFPTIQTDAAINFGNSGGALINTLGQVVGISSAKFNVKRNNETNINLGIPIDIVKEIFDSIKLHGRMIRNWLGVSLEQLNQAGHKHFDPGVEYGNGLQVGAIEKDSPGDLAGLKEKDFIVRFDGIDVKNMTQFRKQFIAIPIGKLVEVEILRNKQPLKLQLQLKEKPTVISPR
jgi:S1-C subfamily serine protease